MMGMANWVSTCWMILGSVLVATGVYIQAQISQDGNHIVYMVGDEDQDYTIYSYKVSNGESTEIMQGEDQASAWQINWSGYSSPSKRIMMN